MSNTLTDLNGYIFDIPSASNNYDLNIPSLTEINDNFTNAILTDYQPLGNDISLGTTGSDKFGSNVVISGDGNTIAVNDISDSSGGKVYIYEYTNQQWELKGDSLSLIDLSDTTRAFGDSMDINNDGNTIIIGDYLKDISDNNVGIAKIYEYDTETTSWSQLGQDLSAVVQIENDNYASSVSINDSGSIVAVSAPNNDISDNGYIQVFEFDNDTNLWSQLGDDICGNNTNDNFGYSLSLDSTGLIVLGTAPRGTDVSNQEYVNIHEFDRNLNQWFKIGTNILGKDNSDNDFGYASSINDTGDIIAISAYKDTPTNNNYVAVYQLDKFDWIQKGSYINNFDSQFGKSIQLSSTGDTLIIGNPDGEVRTYSFINDDWKQITRTITEPSSFGFSVGIDKIGNTIVASDPGTSTDNGYVKVFELHNATIKNIDLTGSTGNNIIPDDGETIILPSGWSIDNGVLTFIEPNLRRQCSNIISNNSITFSSSDDYLLRYKIQNTKSKNGFDTNIPVSSSQRLLRQKLKNINC